MKVVKNDLFDYGLKIYQDQEAFKFSLDSILLAEFVERKSEPNMIIDFCSGNGAIPLILSTRFKAKIMGFEIQKEPFELAYSSIELNKLSRRIKMVHANLSEALEYVLPESVDVVTCNPPYFKYNSKSHINESESKAIARHEIETNLDEIIVSSGYVLKNKGVLYMVHRPERLVEIFEKLKKYNFAVKKIQFVYSKNNKDALMVLIKATKNGLAGLKVGKPINVMEYKSYKEIFE